MICTLKTKLCQQPVSHQHSAEAIGVFAEGTALNRNA
jgi:hypothetical protein